MLAGRRQLSLEETGRRRLRRQSSEIRPILAWQESLKESAEKQQSQVEVVAKKIGQPKPTPPRPIRSPSIRNDSCLTVSRRQVAERLKLGWNKAVAKEGQDKGRQNLNIFLNKSFEARPESPAEEDFRLRRSQSVFNTNEEAYDTDSSSESESDDDPPTERFNEPAPRAVTAQSNIQSTQSQVQQPGQQQQQLQPKTQQLAQLQIQHQQLKSQQQAQQQQQQKTPQHTQLQIQHQQLKSQQQAQQQIQQQQQKTQQQQQQQIQQQRLSASARRAVFKAAGRQRPTTCSPEPRPRLMSAPPQPVRPPPEERSRSAPPRRRQQRKPRRGVEGGEVVTMVSLVSPAGSEDEEDLQRPVHCPPTPDVPPDPSPPPPAPPVLSLRRPLKAVTFKAATAEGPQYRTSYPTRTPTILQEDKAAEEENSKVDNPPTTITPPKTLVQKLGKGQATLPSKTKPVVLHKQDSKAAERLHRAEEVKKKSLATKIPDVIREEVAVEVAKPEPAKLAESVVDINDNANEEVEKEVFKSAKERECWHLFKRMSSRGISVSFETVLRGLLTPTEYRMRRAALMATC